MFIDDFAAKIAFDHVVAVDDFADLQHFGVRELFHAALGRHVNLLADFLGDLLADAMDVLQRDHNALVGRNIYACDTGHVSLLFQRLRCADVPTLGSQNRGATQL